jgi:hypothetical protein
LPAERLVQLSMQLSVQLSVQRLAQLSAQRTLWFLVLPHRQQVPRQQVFSPLSLSPSLRSFQRCRSQR